MKSKTLSRKIPYSEIIGITMHKNTNEYILHLNNKEPDFHYKSKNKNLLICQICKLYEASTNKIFKLCEIDKILKHYLTPKKDKKRIHQLLKWTKNF